MLSNWLSACLSGTTHLPCFFNDDDYYTNQPPYSDVRVHHITLVLNMKHLFLVFNNPEVIMVQAISLQINLLKFPLAYSGPGPSLAKLGLSDSTLYWADTSICFAPYSGPVPYWAGPASRRSCSTTSFRSAALFLAGV